MSSILNENTILTASDAETSDHFGSSVALSDDGSVLAVGATGWDGVNNDAQGGVYIYDWSGSSWVQRGSVLNVNSESLNPDYFGSSVALSSDGSVLVVGAKGWYTDPSKFSIGAVYIYDRNGDTWDLRGSVLTASDAESYDWFGSSVALSSDGSVLVVGAEQWGRYASYSSIRDALKFQGAVYIYDLGNKNDDTRTLRGSVLTASNATTNDYFGSSVALSSDGSVLVVGADRRDRDGSVGTDHGSVYIYDRNGDTWDLRGNVLTESYADPYDHHFGSSVALSSDGSVLAVGAEGWLNIVKYIDQGAVYIYDLDKDNDTRTLRESFITASDPDHLDYFGSSVALSSDGSILAVGAYQWDATNSYNNQGAVYIYSLFTYTVSANPTTVNEGEPLTINVSTTNVDNNTELWWTIESNSGDFDVSSGSFLINNNSGSFTVTPTADATTEDGIETFTVAIRTDSVNGTVVDETNPITINDTSNDEIVINPNLVWDEEKKCYVGKFVVGSDGCSDIISIGLHRMEGNVSVELLGLNPSFPNLEKTIRIIDCSSYKLTPSSLSVSEGGSVTITLETDAGAGDYNYTIYGSSITESDIQEGLTGKFVVNNSGIGVITLNISSDAIVENLETFTLELDNKKSSVSINISDIYYSVSSNPPTVNEGDTVTVTVTTNAPDGSCNYSLSGSTGFSVTDDLDGNVSSTGTVNIQNGTGTVSFTLKEDLITEGQESFTFQLIGCGGDPSVTVVVNDTSTNPIDYSVAANPPTVNEGDTVTVTVTTNAPDGSCNYSLSGSTGFSVTDDLDGNVSSTGTVNIQNGTGTVSFTVKEDLITEGQESFTFQLVGCGNNPSTTVTVNDTSNEPSNPTYSLSVNPYVGGEGDTVTFTLTTTNVPENTQVPYTISGEVELSDFNPPLTSYTGHYFTVGSNGIATQQYTYADDGVPSNFSKSFEVILDNITPEVSVFGVFTESDIIPPTVTIEGHGMSGMLDATHEGYAYGWSDIIVNKEGQYTWSITTASGNITASDFSDVTIDGGSIDYSALSGEFNVTFNEYDNGSTRVMFWIYMAEDNLSELPYEELTLTITYVPDGSYATSTIKIYDMPTSYSTLYHDLPYGETWDPGESVTFELTYNITSEKEMVGTSSLINWVITSTGSGQNIDINDIESIEAWTDLNTTPDPFSFGAPYGLQQDINGDIEGSFDSYIPNAVENGTSYIKITLKSTASLGGKQMRFKLKDPSPTISTPSQFDFVF